MLYVVVLSYVVGRGGGLVERCREGEREDGGKRGEQKGETVIQRYVATEKKG